MKVKVEKTGPCRKILHVDVPADTVAAEYKTVIAAFVKMARVPGFRPGRAPQALVERRYAKEIDEGVRDALVAWLGADAVKTIDPEMGGEDFSQFGLTTEKVPICLFRVGAVAPEKVSESQRTGVPVPSLHSSKFAPLPEPTIKTGITAMTAAAIDLLAKK